MYALRGKGVTLHTHHPRLSAVLARCRAAITGNPAPVQKPAPTATRPSPTPDTPPTPSRPSQRPHDPPAPRVLACYLTADEVRAGRALSRGALRVWLVLYALAVFVARHRGHAVRPSHVVFHLPAVILAALCGYSERHLYRLADELRAAGLLDERGHVGKVGKLKRYTGTLWAVPLSPTAPRPRLRWFDFQHDWRPDFASDYHGEKGAFRDVQAVLSEPFACEGESERHGRLLALAENWAAATRTPNTPAGGGSDMRPAATLRAVADTLPALLALHPRQRHREVSRLAADLSHALNEPGRYRQHCAAIYRAIQDENEQRPGLQLLALQLVRLSVDLAEGAPWRKPGAVLAARLA